MPKMPKIMVSLRSVFIKTIDVWRMGIQKAWKLGSQKAWKLGSE